MIHDSYAALALGLCLFVAIGHAVDLFSESGLPHLPSSRLAPHTSFVYWVMVSTVSEFTIAVQKWLILTLWKVSGVARSVELWPKKSLGIYSFPGASHTRWVMTFTASWVIMLWCKKNGIRCELGTTVHIRVSCTSVGLSHGVLHTLVVDLSVIKVFYGVLCLICWCI